MSIVSWLRFLGPIPVPVRSQLTALIERAGIATGPALERVTGTHQEGLGIAVFDQPDAGVLEDVRELTRTSKVLALSVSPATLDTAAMWRVLEAGAADLVQWPTLPARADAVVSRL